MELRVKKLRDSAILPTRAHPDDAGVDLYTDIEHSILPHAKVSIMIGVALEIPFGYVGLIWDKSSIGQKGIKTLGGVVDAGYRGEVSVVLHNLGNEIYTFNAGDKIAQMLIQKVELLPIIEVSDLSESSRGLGGFGSTGK